MYNFDEQINRIGTNSLKWDLLGKEYLPLWVADMDFQVSPAVRACLQKRVDHGVFGYPLENKEIYQVLIDWIKQEYDAEVPDKNWIKLVPGIVTGLMVASNIGGGKSLTNTPNYCCLLTAPSNAGNEMITVPLRNDNESYSIDIDALQAAVTEDTKLFYLCNPHNPVGRVYTLDELKAVSEFAKKNNLIVISDEAHCDMVYEGKHIPFWSVDEYAREHSITFYSNGKMFNVPDVILAFAVIPSPELRAEFNRLGYAFGEAHKLNVEVGIATYRDSKQWKDELMEYLKGNRDYLESEIRRRFPKAKLPHLQATYLQWVDFTPYGEEVTAEFFKRKAGVFLTEGEGFGDSKYVRINFGTQREILTQALDKMEEAIMNR